jgi:hypothetical protein
MVAEGSTMIDAGDGADDPAGRLVLGDKIGDGSAVTLRPEEVRRHRYHAAGGIDAVHLLGVLGRRKPADEEAAMRPDFGRMIAGEIEPVGMRGIEEQLLRRCCEQHVGIADIERDVAASGALGADAGGEIAGVLEGLAEQEASPAAIEGDVLLLDLAATAGRLWRRHYA